MYKHVTYILNQIIQFKLKSNWHSHKHLSKPICKSDFSKLWRQHTYKISQCFLTGLPQKLQNISAYTKVIIDWLFLVIIIFCSVMLTSKITQYK